MLGGAKREGGGRASRRREALGRSHADVLAVEMQAIYYNGGGDSPHPASGDYM